MTVVWHRFDLRVNDNRAVAEASEEVKPVFFAEPEHEKSSQENLSRWS